MINEKSRDNMFTNNYIRCKFLHAQSGINGTNNKVRIAVCDGDLEALEHTKIVIKQCLLKLKIEAETDCFRHATSLIESVKEYDLFFLAVKMPTMDGFDVVAELRRTGKNGRIIFITKYSEYMQEAFKVQPFRYLLKTDPKEKVQEAIKSAILEDEERKGILLETNGKVLYIFLNEILYVESLGDDMAIVLKDKQYIVRMALKNIANILGENFIQCNRGVFVNMKHILQVQETKVVLDEKIEVAISVRKRKETKKRYIEYMVRQKRGGSNT